jgi:hypothetical protein
MRRSKIDDADEDENEYGWGNSDECEERMRDERI